MPHPAPRAARRFALAALLALAACHVNLVAPYDDQVVKDAVTLQTDFDTLAQTLRNPPPGTDTGYDASKAAYNKVEVDLSGLQTRVGSHTDNAAMLAAVAAMAKTVRETAARHQGGGHLSAAYLDDKQAVVDQQIGILIRTETDKKAIN